MRKVLLSIFVLCVLLPQATHAQPQADKILILKSKRHLMLISNGQALKAYRISLGKNPVGPKTRRGDNKTPEGTYIIDRRKENSQFFRALHVSYPNSNDLARARQIGADPGGDIMIHGLPNGRTSSWNKRFTDWTAGCIAVTNQEIREIWHSVADGTVVEIRP